MTYTEFRKLHAARIRFAGLTTLAAILTLTSLGIAQTESPLYSYTGGSDGYSPQASLAFDAAGNLYGTATFGAANHCPDFGSGCGVVFELSPTGLGGWTYSVLHTFTGGADGGEPYAGLTFDAAGNLYGTASVGGTSIQCSGGCGVVFELSPNGSGGWTYQAIHSFNNFNGSNPRAGVVVDGSGNLYGTTYYGGSSGYGVAYKLSPNGTGGWGELVLHNFTIGADGGWPNAVILDPSGTLYGTTYLGGTRGHCLSYGCGVVFKIFPGGGGWHFAAIYGFKGGLDGGNPGGIAEDASGNLYVTAANGGSRNCGNYGCGSVSKFTYSGTFTRTLLYAFSGGSDGGSPEAPPALDSLGNIYSTTAAGGSAGTGTLFKLSLSAGVWSETVLHNFTNGTDGGYPRSSVVLDGAGNLYGQTNSGGIPGDCSAFLGCGVVYEVTP